MTATSERIDYMDAARSVLMSLGVVLHSARPFAPGTPWLIRDPAVLPLFGWIVDFIHLFRMPAFFFISGFFCALTLERYGAGRFLRQRLPRLVLPLATVALLFNVPQMLWLIDLELLPSPGLRAWLDGEAWVLHLWFLLNLILYFTVAAAVGPRALDGVRGIAARLPRADGLPGALLLVAGALAVFLLVLPLAFAGLLYERAWIFGTWLGLVRFFCPFIIGFAAMSDMRLRDAWFRYGWITLVLALAARVAADRLPGDQGTFVDLLALHWGDLAATWVTLLLFRALVTGPSAFWRYMSDASYSLYLLHHPVILVLGVGLLTVPIGIGWKFALLCAGGLALPLAAHHFIVLRVPAARWLFSGRAPARSG